MIEHTHCQKCGTPMLVEGKLCTQCRENKADKKKKIKRKEGTMDKEQVTDYVESNAEVLAGMFTTLQDKQSMKELIIKQFMKPLQQAHRHLRGAQKISLELIKLIPPAEFDEATEMFDRLIKEYK